MVLKIYNSLAREIEEFKPINKESVGLYTCGPTVYNYPHIGNYRAYIFTDVLKRTLLAYGFGVNHIMNITDVDDKTIRDSIKEHTSLLEFTQFYTKEFFKDKQMLSLLPATKYAKATEHIEEMVLLIEVLLQKEYAYKTPDGSVYFSIKKDKDYGKLSRIDFETLKDNADGRLEQDEYTKEDAQDFALWKAWGPEDGDVFWETSIGKGRPGWHIECSAMSMKHLGVTLDIHTGGIDLSFPHHENEIAQSESVTEKPFVRYFMHNEWLLVDGKKMAKSANNFYTLRNIIEKGYNPLAYRYFCFLTHYRTPINFTFEALQASQNALENLQTFYALHYSSSDTIHGQYKEKFLLALGEDLNTPIAIGVMWDMIKDPTISVETKIGTLTYFDNILGFGIDALVYTNPTDTIIELISKRDAARKEKNWVLSDTLRTEIESSGLKVFDTTDRTQVIKQVQKQIVS